MAQELTQISRQNRHVKKVEFQQFMLPLTRCQKIMQPTSRHMTHVVEKTTNAAWLANMRHRRFTTSVLELLIVDVRFVFHVVCPTKEKDTLRIVVQAQIAIHTRSLNVSCVQFAWTTSIKMKMMQLEIIECKFEMLDALQISNHKNIIIS